MPETVAGLPVHPLVVHAVVVLLPLAAVGVILIAAIPRWRAAIGFTVLVVTAVGAALVPVATMSGNNLADSIVESRTGGAPPGAGQHLVVLGRPTLAGVGSALVARPPGAQRTAIIDGSVGVRWAAFRRCRGCDHHSGGTGRP